MSDNAKGALGEDGMQDVTRAVARDLEGAVEAALPRLSGIGEDLTGMIRRNPVPALLIGIGLGFLIARATRS